MCGIFAYLNYLTPKTRKEIVTLLINGLKRLEYRGYDSAGKYPIDWQDSRISRGNGKWICGKIPAGKEVREIAGKIMKIEPKIWPKLTIELVKKNDF